MIYLYRIVLLLIAALFSFNLPAQNNLVTVKANDAQALFIENNRIHTLWTIDASIAIDRYETGKTIDKTQNTFITDIDTLIAYLRPGDTFRFAVLKT